MDLPSCPACGQSVLDDDVDDCPFCGASLSGKPSAPSPTATAAVTAQAPAQPRAAESLTGPAQKPASRPAREERTPSPSGEEDPFELERSAEAAKQQQVVTLRPRPEKGRRHKVACPMCESVGYTARKAAGRDVRCVNADCNFPVFTAPPLAEGESVSDEPGQENDADESAAQQFWSPLSIGIVAVLGVVGIGAICFFAFREKPETPRPNGGGLVDHPGGDKSKTVKTKPKKKEKKPVDPADRLREIRSGALTMMADNAGECARHLRPLSWHWTVDANARAGQLKDAGDHWGSLRIVASRVPHFVVQPLVTIAWNHRRAGTADGRKQALEAAANALKSAANPPALSRDRYDVAAQLSAVLLALGRDEDARKLIAANDDASRASRMSLFLHRVRYLERFDADAALKSRPFQQPISPIRVSVVILLAAHGEWGTARTFATSQSKENRAACLAVWHEAAAALRTSTAQQRLDALNADATQLPTADLATVYARVAVQLHHRKDTAGASTFLAKARQTLQSEKPPAARTTPTIKQVLNYRRPTSTERIRRLNRAAAFGELARSEVQIDRKQSAAAWTAITQAMAWCHSIAAPASAIKNLLAQTRASKADALRARMEQAYPDDNANQIDEKLRRYRLILTDYVKPDADAHFAVQLAILQGAVQWNPPALLTEVWAGLRKPPATDAQDWLATTVPWGLAMQADISGRPALRAEIRKAIASRKQPDAKQYLRDRVLNALHNKAYSRAGGQFGDRRVDDSHWKNRLLYAVTARLVNADNLGDAEKLVLAVRDPFAQMMAFNLLAARAVELGKTEQLWQLIQSETPAAKVALCHGLISALRIPKAKPTRPKKGAAEQ